MVALEHITEDGFEPFGTVLEFPKNCEEDFYIVDTEEKQPWRIAVFRYSNREIQRMENHPASKESFEPLQGISVLLVAEHETPENYRAFVLNKPVCLKKGIWHQVLSLTGKAQVKIMENLEVASEFYDLEKRVSVYLGTDL